jgi:hypothetical protein
MAEAAADAAIAVAGKKERPVVRLLFVFSVQLTYKLDYRAFIEGRRTCC